jgi:hypothetical protein
LIKHESEVREPGPTLRSKRRLKRLPADVKELFPPLHVPVAPPAGRSSLSKPKPRPKRKKTPSTIVVPPVTAEVSSTFIMQLSAFDSSHRTGVPGTPEILLPHEAVSFFPELSLSKHKYPDALFDVVLNTPTGRELHTFRLWYYEKRATGTLIDEYRLRMNHDTIDMSTDSGGDLLVINKLPPGTNPAYEVTILPQTDPTFPAFLALCTRQVQSKRWGIV